MSWSEPLESSETAKNDGFGDAIPYLIATACAAVVTIAYIVYRAVTSCGI